MFPILSNLFVILLFSVLLLKADLAKIPKPYMPKVLWRDGKFVPNPLLEGTTPEKGQKETGINSSTVMKECNTLMTVK